jgi:hypothetical protein
MAKKSKKAKKSAWVRPVFNLGFNCLRNDGVVHFLDMFCLG